MGRLFMGRAACRCSRRADGWPRGGGRGRVLGVHHGDTDYGYGYGGYGGYYDDYAAGVPAAYSALTYPPNYGRIYQVPTTVYQPAVSTSYVPVTTYQAERHIFYLPVRRRCDCETGY